LVAVAIAVAVVAYINPFKSTGEGRITQPWFYQVEMDDIDFIEVTHLGESRKFIRSERYAWAFVDPPNIPPSRRRWGGLQLLVSGPQTRRDLTATSITLDDLSEYGLGDPETVIDVGLFGERHLQVRLGNETVDGFHHYGQVIGFPEMFLIADAWGDVLTRLVTDPPYPKWYIRREPDSIVELVVYMGDLRLEETRVVQFEKKDDAWTVLNTRIDEEKRPVDMEAFSEILPLLAGPPGISVEVPIVDDEDYTEFGITEDSPNIEIRFGGRTERGTKFTDGILLNVGSKIPGKPWYYARYEADQARRPVLRMPADWIEKILELFDETPILDGSTPQASSGGN
jgi:hypothetical protein